jgi:Nitrate reductase gamma subunit
LLILIYRRAHVRRVAVTTSHVDLLVYTLLLVVIGLGLFDTLFHNAAAADNGYNYRQTVAVWFGGVFVFRDNAQLVASVPLVYQLHVLSAWAILALWPFSRLVHVWSIPFQYVFGLGFYIFVISRFDIRQLVIGRGGRWITGGALAISTPAAGRITLAAKSLGALTGAHAALRRRIGRALGADYRLASRAASRRATLAPPELRCSAAVNRLPRRDVRRLQFHRRQRRARRWNH